MADRSIQYISNYTNQVPPSRYLPAQHHVCITGPLKERVQHINRLPFRRALYLKLFVKSRWLKVVSLYTYSGVTHVETLCQEGGAI